MIDLIKAKDVAVEAVRSVAPKLRKNYGNIGNNIKADKTVVTELDGWAETEIKKTLSAFDPSIGFLGEEHGAEGDERIRWIIDPIDGTEQFIRGIPFCGSMLVLVDGKELLVSVVYNFVTDDLYWATKGGGAWRGDERLTISDRPLDRSFVEIGVDMDVPRELRLLQDIKRTCKAAARYNCGAFTSPMVAQGSIEGRVILSGGGGPWDYAPGALLVMEAGGVAVHCDGAPYDYMRTDNLFSGTNAVVEYALSHYKNVSP